LKFWLNLALMSANTVGAFEAKTHLSALLDRVERGEEILITKHGRPVARLAPVSAVVDADVADAVARLRGLNLSLGDIDWHTLRDEGRRG
jgi:prevent-host-death family protein